MDEKGEGRANYCLSGNYHAKSASRNTEGQAVHVRSKPASFPARPKLLADALLRSRAKLPHIARTIQLREGARGPRLVRFPSPFKFGLLGRARKRI